MKESDGRTAEFWRTSADLDAFIRSLDLDMHSKRQLVMKIYDHIKEAERGAFALGISCPFGESFGEDTER